MRIEFQQKSKEEIIILGIDAANGVSKEIGHIFTPSGSGKTNLNAIQICGFDEAFDLWGCGVYGDKKTQRMKKDIQLAWLYPYDKITSGDVNDIVVGEEKIPISPERQKIMGLEKPYYIHKIRRSRFSFDENDGVCGKCFNHPCTCENLTNYENPYTVKRQQDLYLEKKEGKK